MSALTMLVNMFPSGGGYEYLENETHIKIQTSQINHPPIKEKRKKTDHTRKQEIIIGFLSRH